MKIYLDNELVEQLKWDNLDGIHIRDVVSLDIDLDGNITAELETILTEEYVRAIEKAISQWFNSLTSDTSWYSKIDNSIDCINVGYYDIGLNYFN
jgi:hypothetical protein